MGTSHQQFNVQAVDLEKAVNWTERRCGSCGKDIEFHTFLDLSGVCPNCGQLQRLSAYERLLTTVDSHSFYEFFADLASRNVLDFPGYDEKLQKNIRESNIPEAIVTGICTINAQSTAIAVMDPNFMMGSMGTIVGEKIVLLAEYARKKKLPLIIFCASGGARMQEGMFSLMQMARSSVAIRRHRDAGLLYISVLTHPTTGGTSASFAMQSDLTIAEPGALIGFAGRRVIEQTIKQELPEDFQKSVFLLKHGFIDAIVPRQEMRSQLTWLLNFHHEPSVPRRGQIRRLPASASQPLSVWDRVRLVRSAKRPSGQDYIEKIFEEFFELHGDRYFSDDPAIIAGLTRIKGLPVTVIAQQKGHQIQERMEHNFGMSNPEGYRKALKSVVQAEKFNRPIIFLVDTPGAYPGIGAEERGQARAIADNLYELASVKVPVITLVVGEGGSGGALALSVGDRVIMLENSIYSVITPEGCASILWRDASLAPQAAEALKLTADDLLRFGLIDRIIPEGEDFSSENMDRVCQVIQEELWQTLLELKRLPRRTLVRRRQNKYLAMTRGSYYEKSASQSTDILSD